MFQTNFTISKTAKKIISHFKQIVSKKKFFSSIQNLEKHHYEIINDAASEFEKTDKGKGKEGRRSAESYIQVPQILIFFLGL